MSISVTLAAKDGARYLSRQVDSILPQLHESQDDELIISVDPSSDETLEIAETYAKQNSLVTCIAGPGKGVAANFERALRACKGSHIFLCDQDDVWMPQKVAEVMNAFASSEASLILHDAQVVDEQLQELAPSYFEAKGSKLGVGANILKNSYVGCCMAFKRELLDIALPFPPHIPMHDQWLGILAEQYLSVSMLPLQLIQYCRHGNTSTSNKHAGIGQMLAWRRDLLFALRERKLENR